MGTLTQFSINCHPPLGLLDHTGGPEMGTPMSSCQLTHAPDGPIVLLWGPEMGTLTLHHSLHWESFYLIELTHTSCLLHVRTHICFWPLASLSTHTMHFMSHTYGCFGPLAPSTHTPCILYPRPCPLSSADAAQILHRGMGEGEEQDPPSRFTQTSLELNFKQQTNNSLSPAVPVIKSPHRATNKLTKSSVPVTSGPDSGQLDLLGVLLEPRFSQVKAETRH